MKDKDFQDENSRLRTENERLHNLLEDVVRITCARIRIKNERLMEENEKLKTRLRPIEEWWRFYQDETGIFPLSNGPKLLEAVGKAMEGK